MPITRTSQHVYNRLFSFIALLSSCANAMQVLDYQNCAHTLLPLVASAYALFFMGESMMAMYRAFEVGCMYEADGPAQISACIHAHTAITCLLTGP